MPKKLTCMPAKWWPWLPPSRGDVSAISFGVVVLIVVLCSLVVGRPYFWSNSNWGFGPEWRCAYVPQSEPICIKH
jgi:hypothetical protein